MTRTIVALYNRLDDAQRAIDQLVREGIRREDISLIANDARGDFKHYRGGEGSGEDMAEDTLEGAGIGAVLGGLAGLVVGLGALTIPGVGPLIAAGPIAAALAGAGIGAAAGGLIGALSNLGIPEDQAQLYAEGVRRGGTLVTVTADESHAQHIVNVLNSHSPIDINERASAWRQSGWTGYDANAQPYTYDQIERERSQFMSRGADPIVSRQAGMSDVDRRGMGRTGAEDWSFYEPRFRSHFDTTFTDTDYIYTDYQPAYRYGYDLAHNDLYRGRDWSQIEMDARREWQTRHPDSAWEEFKDAVRAAWETVTLQR